MVSELTDLLSTVFPLSPIHTLSRFKASISISILKRLLLSVIVVVVVIDDVEGCQQTRSRSFWKKKKRRRKEKNTKHVHEKTNDKGIGAHESRARFRWYDSMVVPGATGYYIIDRPSSSVPISCRDPWRSPGTTGLHVNLCTRGGKKRLQVGCISTTTESAGSCNFFAIRWPAAVFAIKFPLILANRNICCVVQSFDVGYLWISTVRTLRIASYTR